MFTDRPGTLSNDFFVNLLDMGNTWKPAETKGLYEGRDRNPAILRWRAWASGMGFEPDPAAVPPLGELLQGKTAP